MVGRTYARRQRTRDVRRDQERAERAGRLPGWDFRVPLGWDLRIS